MKLLSINIAKARPFDNEMGRTGHFKEPVSGPVRVRAFGVGDDDICNPRVHGGSEQAVYLYGAPDYAFWEAELGRKLEPGLFGENLTVSGLECQSILIGDRFRIGSVLLEASAPRNPCSTFAAVMGEPNWVKRFHAARRPGVYARVIEAGEITTGDEVIHIPFAGEKVPVIDLIEDFKNPAPERMRRLLKVPIHKDLRAQYEKTLTQQAQQQQ